MNALPDESTAFQHQRELQNVIEIEFAYVDDSVAQVGDDFAKRWRDHFARPEISGFNDLFVY